MEFPHCRAKVGNGDFFYNWTIGARFRLVRTFDLAPPSGRAGLGGRFPGLKPWAEIGVGTK
jgi:hypothetical protein